jgi:hypothetical protein
VNADYVAYALTLTSSVPASKTGAALSKEVAIPPNGGFCLRQALKFPPGASQIHLQAGETSFRTDKLPASLSKVTDKKDLKNLCAVSKLFYVAVLPFLYEEIIVKCREGFIPGKSNTAPFLRSAPRFDSARGLNFVKDLYLESEFYSNLQYRCYHHRSGMPYTADESPDSNRGRIAGRTHSTDAVWDDDGEVEADEDSDWDDDEDTDPDDADAELEEDIGKDFLFFCQHLKDDSLRSFTYVSSMILL